MTPRLIPCLLLANGDLVKTERFAKPRYVGDPINAVRILNDKMVDELIILDIEATAAGKGPDFDLLKDLSSECLMPLCYGGGVSSLATMEKLFAMGVEKICLGEATHHQPELVREGVRIFGRQSIVGVIEVKSALLRGYRVVRSRGTVACKMKPEERAAQLEELGVGEILVNDVSRDGTMSGLDAKLMDLVANAVSVPVVACGGARDLADVAQLVSGTGVSAVAAGSMVVYYGPHRAVLINYPAPDELNQMLPVERRTAVCDLVAPTYAEVVATDCGTLSGEH